MIKKSKHILISGAIGVLFWIIGEILYKFFTKEVWQPVGIAMYFALFAVIMIIGMFVLAVFRRDYNRALEKGIRPISDNAGTLLALLLVFFLATGLFEFLYEIGQAKLEAPTSYIFVIDDSGSMSTNDPNCERAAAVKRIMEQQDGSFPYAVYKFTDSCQKVKDLAPYRPTDSYQFVSNGGTDIVGALDVVVNDIISGKSNAGYRPRIMLVSDGSSSPFGSGAIIRECKKHDISICSISFGGFFGNSLLNRLASKTGGVYVDINNVDDLYINMKTAITSNSTRNLISERNVAKLDWLYMLMRLVFLSAMAILWSIMKSIAYCNVPAGEGEEKSGYDNVFIFTMFCAVISVLVMEFAVGSIGLPSTLARLVLSVLWTIVPGKFYVASDRKARLGNLDGDGFGGGGNGEENVLQGNKSKENEVKSLSQLSGFGTSLPSEKGSDNDKKPGSESGFGTKTGSNNGFGSGGGYNNNGFGSGGGNNGGGFGGFGEKK